MASLPGGVLWNPRWQALDNTTGAILPLAQLFAYTTGGTFSSLQSLYSDVDLTVALTNPVVADSAGRFPAMYMLPLGYDLRLKTAAGVTVWSCESVEDIGQSFLSNLGSWMADGTRDVASGYVPVEGDRFVSSDAASTANPFVLQLPPLDSWTEPITFKHQSSFAAEVTPDGTDPIEGLTAVYDMPAAASPNFPTITLLPGSSSWEIQSSHGLS